MKYIRGLFLNVLFFGAVAVSGGRSDVVEGNVFGDIWDALSWLVTHLGTLLSSLVQGLLWIVGQVLGLLLHGMMTVVMGVLSGLDLGSILTTSAAAWAGLDPSIAWFIDHSGISQGVTMLGTAYLVRFLLDLIPAEFTRV
jgi:hypothetical protein